MKKLRWAMDGGFWDVDVSAPLTVDGVARPVPGDLLPLGLTRGPSLSRPKQIHFFQRFMAMPFVPLFSHGLSLQRVQSIPLPSFLREDWFVTLLGQFNVHKFANSLKRNEPRKWMDRRTIESIWKQLLESNCYALNLCSEWWLTPEDTLLLSLEQHGEDNVIPRKKAVFQHKFAHHNLIVEATSPALFVDDHGNYWNVPYAVAMDIASVASDSGASCHFCVNHIVGSPTQCKGQAMSSVPPNLLSKLCAKCAVSFKKNFDIWRSDAPKMKMVQPYDLLLSTPHVSTSTIVGMVITGSIRDNSLEALIEDQTCGLQFMRANSSISADLFASASLSAQHGNFQRRLWDLTRLCIRIDIPYGSKFLSGASQAAVALYKSQRPSVDTLQAICPSARLSFQQQIGGPFSLRADAGVTIDLKKDRYFNVNDPVFGVEYALHVLGSAKAVGWYSLKQKEFMLELRFCEV